MTMQTRRTIHVIYWLIVLLGFLIAARPALHTVQRAWLSFWAEKQWQSIDSRLAAQSGDPVAWLKSDDINLNAMVLLDGTDENLSRFPCLSVLGSMIHKKGPKIIQGHRDFHFRKLEKLRNGHVVSLEDRQGTLRHYRVSEIEITTIDGMEARLSDQLEFDGLILSTCYPFRFAGPAPQRYLAWLVEISGNPIPGS